MISAVTPNELFPKFLTQDRTGRAMCAALCAGLNAVLEIIRDGLDEILNPEKMSERRLDEVAWEDNILYDYDADISVKRYLVANAMEMYRYYGTEKAVVQALLTIADSASVVPDADAYAMAYPPESGSNIYAVSTSQEIEPGTPAFDWLMTIGQMVGNVRSTLIGVAGSNPAENVDLLIPLAGNVQYTDVINSY
jgi:P2-related tail formation protein